MMTKYTGETIRTLRIGMNMTQRKLAEILGYQDARVVYQIEAGKMRPPLNKLKRISRALMVNSDLLVNALKIDFESHIRKQSGIK